MKRIGLLGGSFDPIHQGHLQVAKYARKQLSLDEVWFLVAKKTPLKDKQFTSFFHRVNMVKYAIQPYRHFRVCTIEETLPEPSYTIDTVCKLQKLHKDHHFYFIIGDDQYAQLDKWKDIEKLNSLIDFVVVNRNLINIKEYLTLNMPVHPASSTSIRQGDFRYIPKSVRRYIQKHGLYYNDIVLSLLSKERANHVLSTSQLCVALAKHYRMDESVAYLCGILHDIAKELPTEILNKYMYLYCKDKLDAPKALYHAYVGSIYIKHKFYLYDNRITNAIYHHVQGAHKSAYSQIVYIADKIEETRGYDSSEELKVAYKNLKIATQIVQDKQKQYLSNKGVV